MKCANCGAELKVGCIYCSVCGKEAQIVSDYNLLEDDFLRNMLQEREDKIRKEAAQTALPRKKQGGQPTGAKGQAGRTSRQNGQAGKTASQKADGQAGRQKRRVKKRLVFAVAAMVLLVVLIAAIVLMVNHSRANSFDYQMGQANISLEDKNYRAAENYVTRALELKEDDLQAKLLLADIYALRGEERKAIELFGKVCKEHPDCQEAYQKLISLYAKQKDYEAILKLSEGAADEDILGLFTEYLPVDPVFGMEEGVYTQELSVPISAEEGSRVYYTLDGTDPRQGREYQGPIIIGQGETVEIRAIAKNRYELYGNEAKGTFTVELCKPGKPWASPGGGSFSQPQEIVVKAPEGCRVYYTWDGTTPTEQSAQYTQPIAMPEGNNILTLIAVDKHGMRSDVLKCNYIYMPPM